MERKQFTFYRSYYEALRELPEHDQIEVVMAICAYALDGEEPDLSGVSKALFTLMRPTLDSGRNKAESGLLGGQNKQTESKAKANGKQTESKPQANSKQTASKREANAKQTASKKEIEIEIEKENEIEIENDSCCNPCSPLAGENEPKTQEDEGFGKVMTAYMEHIAPLPSSTCVAALRDFCGKLGPDVCLRAIDTAIDAQKTTWPYIRAILRDKLARGIDTLEKWDAAERHGRDSPGTEVEVKEETQEEAYNRLQRLAKRWGVPNYARGET